MTDTPTREAGFTARQRLAALEFAETFLRGHLQCEVPDRAGDEQQPVIVISDREWLRFADVRLARVEFRPPVGTFDHATQHRLRRAITDWINRRHQDGQTDLPGDRRLRLDAIGVYLDARGLPHVVDYVPNAY